MFSHVLFAAILVNPMLPTDSSSVITATPAPSAPSIRTIRYPQLEDIYLVGEQKRVKLNGRWYQVDERANGWRVTDIWLDRVRIERQSQEKILILTSSKSAFIAVEGPNQ